MAILASACEAPNWLRGIRLGNAYEEQSLQVYHSFMSALARGDTVQLDSLSTAETMHEVRELRAGRMFDGDISKVARTQRVDRVRIEPLGADVEFSYELGEERHEGVARVRVVDGAWKVTEFAASVERQ